MGEIGICINIKGLGEGLWSVDDLADLRILNGWIRTPVQGSLNMLDSLNSLPASLKVLVTLNNECDEVSGDWSGWEGALQALVDNFGGRVTAVACGNELDRFEDTPPAFSADLVRRALPILRPAGIPVIATSVAGGDWVNYLTQLVAACGDNQPDYYDVHLYGQSFDGVPQSPAHGTMANAFATARNRVGGRRLVLSEGGVKRAEVGGDEGQSNYVDAWVKMVQAQPADQVLVGTYFALYDEVGAPGEDEQGPNSFGLISHRDLGREQRKAFTTFRDLM